MLNWLFLTASRLGAQGRLWDETDYGLRDLFPKARLYERPGRGAQSVSTQQRGFPPSETGRMGRGLKWLRPAQLTVLSARALRPDLEVVACGAHVSRAAWRRFGVLKLRSLHLLEGRCLRIAMACWSTAASSWTSSGTLRSRTSRRGWRPRRSSWRTCEQGRRHGGGPGTGRRRGPDREVAAGPGLGTRSRCRDSGCQKRRGQPLLLLTRHSLDSAGIREEVCPEASHHWLGSGARSRAALLQYGSGTGETDSRQGPRPC